MHKNILISIAVLAGIGILILSGRGGLHNTESANPIDIVSPKAIHWHPELMITIKGAKQGIPANIGVGMQYAGYPRYDAMMMMTDMHTHDDSGTLHWEVMEGPVTKDDVRIASFFAVWSKTFSKECIFEYCNGPDGIVKMFVNGKENVEFENYLVNDKDKIEIRYE